jgi:hypothetical protein
VTLTLPASGDKNFFVIFFGKCFAQADFLSEHLHLNKNLIVAMKSMLSKHIRHFGQLEFKIQVREAMLAAFTYRRRSSFRSRI